MPRAYCRVLGPARLTINDVAAPQELLWRKHLALLVYLARSPRRTRTREHLLGLLWGDKDERQARHSLSEALGAMRRALGERAVRVDVDQVGIEPGAVVLDTEQFVQLTDHGDWARAAALVEGAFLEGLSVPEANEFENWLAAERAEWRARGVDAIARHAEARLSEGDAQTAAREAERALVLAPTSEIAVRAAMRALALCGDRAAALRVLEEFTRVLHAELGNAARPAKETVALADRIREARVGRRVIAAAAAAPRRIPIAGRTRELAILNAAWQRVCTDGGRGHIAIIEGESGAGVSRLLEEFVSRARLDHATVAAARAVPGDRVVRWSALSGLVAGGLADAPGLAGAPPTALATLRQIGPDSEASLAEAFAAGVAAVADEQPLCLAIDDAQWIDAETLTMLPRLARDSARQSVLIALGVVLGAPESTRFDELRARFGRDLDGSVVRVGPLDEAALRQLVAVMLPDYENADVDRLLRRVRHDTAGIPLLAVSMLEAVADGMKLAAGAPAPWPAPERTLLDSLPNDLPPAVVGSVCERFRRLLPEAQQVAGAAAALGGRTTLQALLRATGLARDAVDASLDLLEWERWLLADARGYVFVAPIVRAILLQEMITPGQARRYRGNAGDLKTA